MCTVVIRWPVSIKSWDNQRKNDNDRQKVKDNDPVMWEYFVKGSEAMVTDNQCLGFGIANGTDVIMHSLALQPTQQNYIEYIT